MGLFSIPLQNQPQPMAQLAERGQRDAIAAKDLMLQTDIHRQQIEAQNIALQQQKQQQRDQELLRDAMVEHDGDLSKVPNTYLQRGGSVPTLNAFQKNISAVASQRAKTNATTLANDIKRHDMAAGELTAFEDLPDDQKMSGWSVHLDSLLNKGLITPDERRSYPATYPGADQVKAQILGLRTKTQIDKQAADQQKADAATSHVSLLNDANNLKRQEAEAKAPGVAADTERKIRGNWADKLAAAAEQGEDEFMDIYHQMPEDVRKTLPITPQDYDENKTADQIRRWGMSSKDVATNEGKAAREERIATSAERTAKNTERHQRVMEGIAGSREGRERVQTGNSAAVSQRQARAEVNKHTITEAELNRERRSLGSAIQAGATLNDKNNQPRDLQAEYEEATDELKKVIADKYDALDRAGAGKPRVGLDEAIAALDAGDDKLFKRNQGGPPAATPPKPAKPPVVPPKAKLQMSRPEAEKKARAAGKDPGAYIRALQAHGYEVK
jgi:hypothetical protein